MSSKFPQSQQLTAIAMVYQNPDQVLIADKVLPPIPTAEKFQYTEYDVDQGYTVPDTRVGRKSQPNEVEFTGKLVDASTEDFALDDVVPVADIEAWEKMPKPPSGGPVDPRILSTQYLMGLVGLDREVRVSNMVFNTNTYLASQKQALAGTDKWSDYVNSDPLSDLLYALDVPLFRPNYVVLGQQVWTTLRMHPKLVQGVNNTNQGSGVITKERLAELLEVKEIVVGSAFVNTARKGMAANRTRAWANGCALLHLNTDAAQARQPTFGFTAKNGDNFAGVLPEPTKGMRGSERVRAGKSLKELVVANSMGYYFSNPI